MRSCLHPCAPVSLGIATLLAVGVVVPREGNRPRSAAAADVEIDFAVVPQDRFTGEPYELAGNRLVFTNWYYVRPGSFAWIDAHGKTVTANARMKIGPFGAKFFRYDDAPSGVRIVVERPHRSRPVLAPARPWEQMGLNLGFVLRDGQRYRAWGSSQGVNGRSYPCYFESADGVHWERPSLGLIEYEGSTDNNLLGVTPQSVFVDPTAPPTERYKGVARADVTAEEFAAFLSEHPDRWEHRALRKDAEFILGLFGYTSPDGITWKRLPEPFTIEHSDTTVIGRYDPVGKKYMIFTRNYFVGPRSPRAPHDPVNMSWLGEMRGAGRRSIGYTESDHFGDFPLSRLLLAPRPDMSPAQVFYTNGYTTIPGAPDQHLLFPTVWDTSDDSTFLDIASSHDGRVWNWLPGGPFMETAEFGEFDGGCLFWQPNLFELANGDFILPYTGYSFPHKYPRGAWSFAPGYAVWPKGRLIAIEAIAEGRFSTVSLLPPGRHLRINATTKRAGHILVAVTRRNGQPLPGRSFDDAVPIVGDQHWSEVRWRNASAISDEADLPVCLQFRLTKAKIYGLEFD